MKNKSNNLVYTGTTVLNVFLLAAIVFLMMYFVVVSNTITSFSYKLGLLNEELSGLMETNALLIAQKLSIENSSATIQFAESHDMVQVGHVTHMFDSADVALQR